jgi:hypothetical protein
MGKIRLPVQETENATHLEVEVYYDKGGTNWYSGREEARGIYLRVGPIAIRNGFELFLIGGNCGRKKFLEGATRLNRKRVEQLAASVAEDICSKTGIGWELVQFVLAQGKLVLLDAA